MCGAYRSIVIRNDVGNTTAIAFILIVAWLVPPLYGPAPYMLPMIAAYATLAGFILFCDWRDRMPMPLAQIGALRSWQIAATLNSLIGLAQYSELLRSGSYWGIFAGSGGAYGQLLQRNHFATLTSIGVLVFMLQIKSMKLQHREVKFWCYLALISILVCANAASSSRTGGLQILLIFAMVLFWNRNSRWNEATTSAVTVIAVYCCAVTFILLSNPEGSAQGILGRLAEGGGTCSSRIVLWRNVLHLISQRPWFGWGWGELDYAHFIAQYPGARFCEILDNAHNLPLHLAVEMGTPIAAMFCGTCLWLFWRNKPWAEVKPTRQIAWGVLALIGLHSLLEYPLWYGPFQLATLLCFGLLWVTRESALNGEIKVQLSKTIPAVTASVLMVFCTYAGWDYWRISQIYLPPAARSPAYQEDTLFKIQDSWLFRNQVRFAELTTTPLVLDNAVHINALAKTMLHFSSEPRVVEKVIESAVLLHQDEEALFYLQRYKAAFPDQHARWSAVQKKPN